MINQEKFNEELVRHKKGIAILIATRGVATFGFKKLGEDLALAYAECKCEKCGAEENLQIHHIINRKVKGYMEHWKWASQRLYWANMIVLCEKHHREIEGFTKQTEPEYMGCIPEKRLNYVKRKFSIEVKGGEENDF